MLFRLVTPVRRKGTSNAFFMRCIPADVRERMVGLSIMVPIGPERVPCRITAQTETIG